MKRIKAWFKLFLTDKPKPAIMATSTDGEKTMTKQTEKNYTEAQEARLAEFDVIDNALATELAAEFGKTVASVRAKAARMGSYQAKVRTSKTGGPIERKEAIVADIAALVGANMDGLEKAGKEQLVAIRAALQG